MDENYLKFCNKYNDFIQKYNFIFNNQSKTVISFDAYISHFFKERGIMDFFLYSPHAHYETDILEQYRGRFVYTTNLINSDGSRSLNSVVQESPETHLIIRYPFTDERFFCLFDIYTKSPKDYLDFLTKNEKFQFKENKRKLGFVSN